MASSIASNITPAQAAAMVNLFNNSPTQQKYTIVIQNSGGAQASTTFTFSLQKPNILDELGASILPWNWATVAGEAWTAMTTGNADVTVLTSSPLLISNVNTMILDNQHPLGTESLDISTPADFFDFLYHQINSVITVTAKIYYCTSSGALVGLTVTPDVGAITSAGYTIVSQSGLVTSSIPSVLGSGSASFLQVGTLDSQLISLAQPATSSSNGSEVYGNSNGTSSNNNQSVVVTPTTNNSSSNVPSTSSSNSLSNVPSTSSSSTPSTYGMSSTGATTGGGGNGVLNTTSSVNTATTSTNTPTTSKSKTTEYLVIGGVAVAAVIGLLFMSKGKHK
ncbi:MAG: hypothetical protein OH335_04365 [Candidatus Parvarchaeota archaeon]|nr:hypothetical protein [Candidatus Jingweiarchaeum tengchongense]